ncbi:FAD/NAD(P)-binding protein [Pseudomonas sp. R1-18]
MHNFPPSDLTLNKPAAAPPQLRIAIVGMGSRGLSILEQVIGLMRDTSGLRLRIDVFDPRMAGSGLHHSEQPDYLMLNTMAGQLSAFSSAFPASDHLGMTFLQWCNARQVRLDERGHVAVQGGRGVRFGDFVPRKLLGRYLQDCYRLLIQQCPAHVQVQHHAEAVTQCGSLAGLGGQQGWRLATASGWQLACDALFLTTGHGAAATSETVGQCVAIEGLGLTAMDTLAGLTEGRGGRFIRDGSLAGWRYQASGREPRVFMYSRSGLPFHARPRLNDERTDIEAVLPRLYFTAQAIDALRPGSARGRLDFRQDVLPLIEAEMRAVFYQARVRLDAPDQLRSVQQQLLQATDCAKRRTLFAWLAEQWGPFEPRDWLTTEPWAGDPADYARWFRQWIERDLALSRLGAARSPVKQALEVWRDYRDLLRRVADHNGLTETSTLDFHATWAGLSNRLVGGPQHERYEDLLALIQAGVVTLLPPGVGHPACDDTVISARTIHNGLSAGRQPLLDDLLDQGLIRAAHAYPADGLETDRCARAVRKDGAVNERLWVLGPLVEGCTFYNHYVPTPDPACLAPLQARAAVQSCLRTLTADLRSPVPQQHRASAPEPASTTH